MQDEWKEQQSSAAHVLTIDDFTYTVLYMARAHDTEIQTRRKKIQILYYVEYIQLEYVKEIRHETGTILRFKHTTILLYIFFFYNKTNMQIQLCINAKNQIAERDLGIEYIEWSFFCAVVRRNLGFGTLKHFFKKMLIWSVIIALYRMSQRFEFKDTVLCRLIALTYMSI